MCSNCANCFSEEEATKLKKLGWNIKQIDFVEHTIVENKIKDLIK